MANVQKNKQYKKHNRVITITLLSVVVYEYLFVFQWPGLDGGCGFSPSCA